MSKRNRNRITSSQVTSSQDAPATTHVIASTTHVDDTSSQVIANDTTHANVVANADASTSSQAYVDVASRVTQRTDETTDAYTKRIREIVRLLATLRTDDTLMQRDRKTIRRALRDRDYYISKIERRSSRLTAILADA